MARCLRTARTESVWKTKTRPTKTRAQRSGKLLLLSSRAVVVVVVLVVVGAKRVAVDDDAAGKERRACVVYELFMKRIVVFP